MQSHITIAVSKTQPSERIRELYSKGYRHFGENYVSEALSKQPELTDLDIIWHFIGAIQSNKTTDIATHFDYVHSVDRLKIARRLSVAAQSVGKTLQIFIQVNPQDEVTKAGVSVSELDTLITEVRNLPHINLVGLMCIPSKTKPEKAFNTMQKLKEQYGLKELSMGMSEDYEQALTYGATMIRLGTKLFGKRTPV